MAIQSFLNLHNVLRLDAASCVATGLASILGASWLSGALGFPGRAGIQRARQAGSGPGRRVAVS